MKNWNDYEKAAEKGPLQIVFKVFGAILIFSVAISVVGYGLGWFSEAAQVAQEEFGPRAALQKYEWFKDAASQLDKKRADIKVYQSRIKGIKEDYADITRRDWPRSDREQFNLWRTEVTGVIASYNGLAAEYNSQMVKFNWRFANRGELPKGATEPLPREFKPYITE